MDSIQAIPIFHSIPQVFIHSLAPFLRIVEFKSFSSTQHDGVEARHAHFYSFLFDPEKRLIKLEKDDYLNTSGSYSKA